MPLKVTVSFASKENAVLALFMLLGEILQSRRLVALAESLVQSETSNSKSEISVTLLVGMTMVHS